MVELLRRVCVKLYATEPNMPDATFVPVFHEWIRDRAIDGVLLDVADYTHVPDGPGVMLIAHDVSFALDRSDGRFGLLAQRRRSPADDAAGPAGAIQATLKHALVVADRLEKDARVTGRLAFDRTHIRIEANDRLNAPNTDETFRALQPIVAAAIARVFADGPVQIERAGADSRNRLTFEVTVLSARPVGG